MPPDALQLYKAYYAARDPWFLAVKERKLTNWIGPGSALCTPSQFERTEFYCEFFGPRRYPAFYQVGAMIDVDDGPPAVLTILRERRCGDFGESDIESLRALVPHMRRALKIRRKFAALTQMETGTGALLGSLDAALIAVDGTGRVRSLNDLAEATLRSGDVLRLCEGRLTAALADESAALQRLLGTTGSQASSRQPPGGHLTLHSGERSLHLTVLPLGTSARGPSGGARALVTFYAPGGVPRSRELTLVSLFRLTPAEVRVTMLLLEGLELRQIAENTAASYETVRFQLKSVFQKLGVKRQSQAVRLVSRLPGSSCDESRER
jgi:DNA-binding CsgD family transcriptional regulator